MEGVLFALFSAVPEDLPDPAFFYFAKKPENTFPKARYS
jgi:hypothetical protein